MTGIIIQARMGSFRLMGKVLKEINGHPMLWHVVNRLKNCQKADKIILAIPDNEENNILEEFCRNNNLDFFRGSETDVLSRYYETAKKFNCDIIVRVTSDCPLIDPEIVDLVIEKHLESKADYTSNIFKRTFPRGFDAEVFNLETLEKAFNEAKEKHQREHVTPYIYENPGMFQIVSVEAPEELNHPEMRLTVDVKEDLELIRKIDSSLSAEEIVNYLLNNSNLLTINQEVKQKELK